MQLSAYGGVTQLRIIDVALPEPTPDEVVVRVVAAGTNPGESAVREGLLRMTELSAWGEIVMPLTAI